MATAVTADSDSDYGWDLSREEEEQLASLLSQNPTQPARPASIAAKAPRSTPDSNFGTGIEAALAVPSSLPDDEPTGSLFEEKNRDDFGDVDVSPLYQYEAGSLSVNEKSIYPFVTDKHGATDTNTAERRILLSAPVPAQDKDITYPDLSNAYTFSLFSPPPEPKSQAKNDAELLQSATKSPLALFRTYPRKPLSVTELASGAWCELQYEYTLTLLPGGKKTRTSAMKAGSKVHQELEDEVHTTVKIDITSKEDAFGLKLWNIVQGLRTLRETGLTRELEVWGFVDGNVVNGLIDELTTQHPDEEFEEECSQGSKASKSQDSQQAKMTEFFPGHSETPQSKIYLKDYKTRGSSRPPEAKAVRPTKIQLFLYHRFLSDMAAGHLDLLQVIRRYGLDLDAQFTDAFIAQIGGLHDEIFYDTSTSVQPIGQPDSQILSSQTESNLIRYPTLRSLVPLLTEELRLTFPHGADSVGSFVSVQYRLRPKAGDELTGQKIIQTAMLVDNEALDGYLDQYMQWWRGERQARGVDIEDAGFKCRSCEFAGRCEWRKGLDEENLRRATRRTASKGSTVA